MAKKIYKVGDEVVAKITTTNNNKKLSIRGIIKSIEQYYGQKTYIITGGVIEDFSTRTIK